MRSHNLDVVLIWSLDLTFMFPRHILFRLWTIATRTTTGLWPRDNAQIVHAVSRKYPLASPGKNSVGGFPEPLFSVGFPFSEPVLRPCFQIETPFAFDCAGSYSQDTAAAQLAEFLASQSYSDAVGVFPLRISTVLVLLQQF